MVISALMPTTVTRKPLSIPMPTPARIATGTAKPRSWLPASEARTAPQRADAEPTERSNWPAISSIVAGAAMMPVTAAAVRMLTKLS